MLLFRSHRVRALAVCLPLAGGLGVAACDAGDDGVAPTCAVTAPAGAVSVPAGETRTATATASCVGLDAPRLAWRSSAPDVAAVDSVTGQVRGLAPGSATLRASVVGLSGIGVDVPVVVTACVPGSGIVVSPPSVTIPIRASFATRASVALTTCTAPTTLTYGVDDPAIARVDSLGVVTGLAAGETVVRIRVPQNPALAGAMIVTVTGAGGFFDPPNVSPSNITFGVGDTLRLRASVTLPPSAPAGTDTTLLFRTANPCIATVSPTGLVTGVSAGTTTLTVFARSDTNVRTTVGVTVGGPAVLRMTLQSVTTGTPPVAADLDVLRGTITVTIHVDPSLVPTGGVLELTLAGRMATSAAIPATSAGGAMLRVPLTVATDARDVTGARLYANGPTSLAVTLRTPAPANGCAAARAYSLTQSVTVRNP